MKRRKSSVLDVDRGVGDGLDLTDDAFEREAGIADEADDALGATAFELQPLDGDARLLRRVLAEGDAREAHVDRFSLGAWLGRRLQRHDDVADLAAAIVDGFEHLRHGEHQLAVARFADRWIFLAVEIARGLLRFVAEHGDAGQELTHRLGRDARLEVAHRGLAGGDLALLAEVEDVAVQFHLADDRLQRRRLVGFRLLAEDARNLHQVEHLEAGALDLAVHRAGCRAFDLDRAVARFAAPDPALADVGELDVAIGGDLLLRAESLLHHQGRRADLAGRELAEPGDCVLAGLDRLARAGDRAGNAAGRGRAGARQQQGAEAVAIERRALHVERRNRDDELAEVELEIVELEVGGSGGIRQEQQQEPRRAQRPGAGKASAGQDRH